MLKGWLSNCEYYNKSFANRNVNCCRFQKWLEKYQIWASTEMMYKRHCETTERELRGVNKVF